MNAPHPSTLAMTNDLLFGPIAGDTATLVISVPQPAPVLSPIELIGFAAIGTSIALYLAVIASRLKALVLAVIAVAAAMRESSSQDEDFPPDDDDGEPEPEETPVLKLVGRDIA